MGIGLFSKNLQPCDIDFCDFSFENTRKIANFAAGSTGKLLGQPRFQGSLLPALPRSVGKTP